MEYDVIIIGAGSAGAILATRLTEDPDRSVLLIEAGPDYEDNDKLPEEVKFRYQSTRSIWDSDHIWKYMARGTDEADIEIPRGRVTGGSSAINGTIFLRGIPEDYDNWADLGNDQWSFQNLVPYFNKIETDITYKDDPGDIHGSSGPMICHRFQEDEWLPATKAFVDACLDSGYPFCEDANAPGTTGVGPTPLNNPNGIRWSTAIGYLPLSRHRLNLTIRANVSVKKILFDITGKRPRAIGVEAVSDEKTFIVRAKEVILTAGAIGSPQILMLSGIGPQEHLREFGIDSVLNLPGVGQNLRDHPLIALAWSTKPDVTLDLLGPRHQALLRYTADGSRKYNDMIAYMFAVISNASYLKRSETEEPVGIGAMLGLNQVQSSGELKLNSNDYRKQPYLDYNLLDKEEDMRRYRDGVRMLTEMADHTAMSSLIENRLYPPDSILETNENLDKWIRKNVSTGHHISCTAKMGPLSDPMAVVDQYGKVHGADGLRVADASIMPDCVRANINVTVMVIGERIADFVLGGD